MNLKTFEKLLEKYKEGTISKDDVLNSYKSAAIQSLEFAQLDHHRELRQGFPEVVFCEGKTPSQVASIADAIYRKHGILLATRANKAHYEAVSQGLPDVIFNEQARIIHSAFPHPVPESENRIAVVTAGTSDIPVAEEAVLTCQAFGYPPARIFDVGVAGLHRLNHHWEKISAASILIVVAGMEGALASVLGGLVDKPVIAVPTSVGYGTSFGGLTALMAMLNSCASNVVVVNVDNGFGAGFTASLILRQILSS